MDRLFNIEPAISIAQSRLETPMTVQDQVSELYETLRDDVFRYLLLLGADHEQAQELCQETFLRLYTELRFVLIALSAGALLNSAVRKGALSQRLSRHRPGLLRNRGKHRVRFPNRTGRGSWQRRLCRGDQSTRKRLDFLYLPCGKRRGRHAKHGDRWRGQYLRDRHHAVYGLSGFERACDLDTQDAGAKESLLRLPDGIFAERAVDAL
jgi:hypothetical protein